MSPSIRRVEPEELDGLAEDDPRGLRSRRDLRRVHAAMRTTAILRRAVARLGLATPPTRILELGAGDGTLLLQLARTLRPAWNDVQLTLLDRCALVSEATRAAYLALGWRVTLLRSDVLEWAAGPPERRYDLCFANLFLHHFEDRPLRALLQAVGATTHAFIACEPRRDALAWWGSHLVGFLGVNAVTRADAVKSVAAGFAGRELTTAWGEMGGDWCVRDFPAWPFSQCFTAVRGHPHAV